MQRPSEQKRRVIHQVATRLFATRPFHEVRLEDIAAAARIGKGTIYVYFKSKEDLYARLVREGFAELVTSLEKQLQSRDLSPQTALRAIVQGLAEFALRNPLIYQLMRAGQASPPDAKTIRHRVRLGNLIAATIRRGIREGDFHDPHPELTAQFIPAAVRASILYGPSKLTVRTLTDQILLIIGGGLKRSRGRS